MKKIVMVVYALAVCASLGYAREEKFCVLEKEPTAKSPAGAVVESAGIFVGKIASAIEISATGERKLTVENETGECRIFPFCTTTKVVDGAFNTVTANQLELGERVKVEYVKESGVDTAKTVTVEKKAQ